MFSSKNIFSVVLVIFFIYSPKIKTSGTDFSLTPKVKAVLWLTASGVALSSAEKLGKIEAIKGIADCLDVDPRDVGNVAGLTFGLKSLAPIVEQDIQKTLNQFGNRTPVVAGVTLLTQTTFFQEIAKNIPVIGRYFTCENQKCTGVCKHCRLAKTTMTVGVYTSLTELIKSKFPNF